MERFWSKVSVRSDDKCWLWKAACSPSGYGRFSVVYGAVRTTQQAHRVAYELVKGVIPDGMIVRHDCDTPACCNPAHLQLGTHQDNVDDRIRRGRSRYVAVSGNRNGNAKLRSDDRTELLRMYQDYSISKELLATLFRISPARVGQLCNAAVPGNRTAPVFEVVVTPDDVSEHTPAGDKPRLGGQFGR